MDRAVTYNSYLKVDELLMLQRPLSDGPEHDELLFIVIHQVDELWFKVVLRELVAARNLFALRPVPENALAGAVASLRRVTICFELASQHFRLM